MADRQVLPAHVGQSDERGPQGIEEIAGEWRLTDGWQSVDALGKGCMEGDAARWGGLGGFRGRGVTGDAKAAKDGGRECLEDRGLREGGAQPGEQRQGSERQA